MSVIDVAVNILVGLLGAALGAILFARLVQISWKTAKPLYAAMYLLKFVWSFGVVYAACHGEAQVFQLAGVTGILCWCLNTRRQWCNGPPEVVLSRDGDFDSRPHLPDEVEQ